MTPVLLPASAVIATRNRPEALRRTLESLGEQSARPAEIVVVDSSENDRTESLCRNLPAEIASRIIYQRAMQSGAAVQRNQGVAIATQEVIWFHDDDVLFEGDCVSRLWAALHSDPEMGGVNAMIVNQQYSPPGRVTRMMLRLIGGNDGDLAGRVVGPAVNLLPADRPDLPEIVPVDWLNTTCAMYRRAALPDPPFPEHFTGYSLCEDLTLSLVVGRAWKLANARTARIFHDSQPGDHKRGHALLAEMGLVNRHYVMAQVLERRRAGDYLRFAAWEAFHLANAARGGPARLAAELWGKSRGITRIATGGGR